MQVFTAQEYLHTNTEGFTKRVLHQTPEGMVFVLNFTPGQTLPPHTHEQSQLIVMVQAGSGEVTIDGQVHPIEPHMVLVCSGQETFSVKNTGDDTLTLTCILCPTPANPAYARNIR